MAVPVLKSPEQDILFNFVLKFLGCKQNALFVASQKTTLSTSGPSSYHPVLIYKKGQSAAPSSGGSLTKSNFLHILNSRKFLFLLYQ